jgi:hypothetical protein
LSIWSNADPISETDLYSIPDGGTLRKLENGLEIVRRRKHEWLPTLDGMQADKLAERTGKTWGSKFYCDWTLPALVEWIKGIITEEGWTLRPGQSSQTDRVFNHDIGLAAGKPTPKIRVVCDGRYVHAYPIAEQ